MVLRSHVDMIVRVNSLTGISIKLALPSVRVNLVFSIAPSVPKIRPRIPVLREFNRQFDVPTRGSRVSRI